MTEARDNSTDTVSRAVARVEAAITARDWDRAYQFANTAISQGLRHPLFFMVRGRQMEEARRLQLALDDYQKASALAPADVGIFDAIAICAFKANAFDQSIAAFDAAIALQPRSANLHYRRGLVLAQAGDDKSAQEAYEAALAIAPEFVDAMSSLSLVFARRGETERARILATDALVLAPADLNAAITLAQVDLSEHQYARAEEQLNSLLGGNLLPPDARAPVLAMLGDALDGQQRYAEAIAAYTRQNAALDRMYPPHQANASAFDFVRRCMTYFENETSDRWCISDDGEELENTASGHVFLLGFMRSGTTLLQQILAVNPDVVALDERGLLGDTAEKYMAGTRGLDCLAELGGTELARERKLYWERARKHVPNLSGKILVDKQPMNTDKFPLISKLFPRARVLFVLRDPRDVVFSCFRRNFTITATQYEFLTLERCAHYYAAMMQLTEIYREKLCLNLLECRYEDIVTDFDNRVQGACEFVGIKWSDSMRRFNETAPMPALLSPSTQQVRRPLFREGIGYWRRYADELKTVFPILDPWIVKFGYPRD